MSKQINFYSWPEELGLMQDWLLANGVLFIKQPIQNPDYLLDSNNTMPNGNKEWSKVYLTDINFTKKIFLTYNESQKHYFLNELPSWVVEFSRPIFYEGRGICRARLFFDLWYYEDGGELVRKDEEFVKWAQKLLTTFKKEFLIKFKTSQADYATKEFAKNYNDSIQLSL